jgi:tetratricopeptide (TPR) repeat protein
MVTSTREHRAGEVDVTELTGETPPGGRLNSWKEIAAYFGKDERTVKRWEATRGMPVRRLPRGTRSSVFAYPHELEAWLRGEPASSEGAVPGWRTALFPIAMALAISVVLAAGASTLVLRLRHHTPPEAAVVLYRQGVVDWNSRTAAGFDRARREFTSATTLDPDYAEAWVGLANVDNLISQYTDAPAAASYASARVAAEKAIELNPNLAEAWAALAFNLFYGAHEFDRSAELFDKAVALDPSSPQTLHWAALTEMHLGDFTRPLELISRAQQLAPDSRAIRANKALILFHAGRADEARKLLGDLRQAAPDYLATPSYLATIDLATGRYTDFLDAYEEAATVGKNAARLAIAAKARAGYAQGGNDGMLMALLDEQSAQHLAGNEPAYPAAVTAAMLGRADDALALLEKAVAAGEPDTLGLRIEEAFRPLHGNPRFTALLQKVGLPLPPG